MIKIGSRKFLGCGIAVLSLALLAGCASQNGGQPSSTTSLTPSDTPTPTSATSLTYTNKLYQFTFTLPLSWTGYTVIDGTWSGYDPSTNKTVQTGSLISLRNPKWTAAKKMQDIPIMVFTIGQWNSLIKQGFTVSAVPIPPSELARNTQFVFALPARYNYAFPAGYQEVEQILKSKPLHTS